MNKKEGASWITTHLPPLGDIHICVGRLDCLSSRVGMREPKAGISKRKLSTHFLCP